ncbi:Putative zinc-finger [Marininema mesophilum]|uniref:Anti-sigma-W factor RsiW n=1 Tax=Marininema mesophilum TaxID=1048340 RepID=A0A1H3B919_9BACL|nr:DUF4367 domain-containing protein [Marininema mesophilum]SDX38285.1 Putative zinc-finger [Marininema mesophilum]
MHCYEQGTLQAYIDGELSRDKRKGLALHLEQCKSCHDVLSHLKELNDWTTVVMAESCSESEANLRIDVNKAWNQLNQRLHSINEEEVKSIGHLTKWKRGMKSMDKKKKWWMGGIAVVTAMAVTFSIPQAQAAASKLLSVFRVDKVEYIKVNQEDIEEMKDFLSSRKVGNYELQGLAKVNAKRQGKDQTYKSVEEAKKAGYDLPSFPKRYRLSKMTVYAPVTMHVELNAEKINRLLNQLQVGEKLDQGMDGKRFTLRSYPEVNMELATNSFDGQIYYTAQKITQIKTDNVKQVEKLQKTLLSLPFIPENIRGQLRELKDWRRTLPIPVMEEKNAKEISVNGGKGILWGGENKDQITLMWQKGDIIHRLNGIGGKISEKELITIAESIE